jgi:hypothetical protein
MKVGSETRERQRTADGAEASELLGRDAQQDLLHHLRRQREAGLGDGHL